MAKPLTRPDYIVYNRRSCKPKYYSGLQQETKVLQAPAGAGITQSA